ncbi:hypothetical protein QEZ54_08430 [Catellatospora sp. KI3]|uniref:hypothetical protein n=1 Tax=Catellatospora sp. KI3 TaxID=3041620 RepID=UPI00248256AD|nr:hypothetical protein [Catellatospora sp. KI3]MDI1460987.1 hypothetical protein [Catellatospora sp. KI3]
MAQIVTVCICADVPTEQVANAAKAAFISAVSLLPRSQALLRSRDASQLHPHFVHTARRRSRGELVAPREHLAAGAPVRLLNLDWMAQYGYDVARNRWHVWNQVVKGTQAAKPLSHFIDRHRSTPDDRYTLAQAHRDYQSQSRVAAMEIYNRSGRGLMHLPLDHLEALQVSCEAYAEIGYQVAVPGNAIVDRHGVLFECRPNSPLATVWEFISKTRSALQDLSADDRLVALIVQ